MTVTLILPTFVYILFLELFAIVLGLAALPPPAADSKLGVLTDEVIVGGVAAGFEPVLATIEIF